MSMPTRILASAAAAAALAVAAPALAGGQASSTQETNVTSVRDGEAHNERVIVLTDRLRDHGQDAGSDEHRRVRVYGMDGADMAGCADHPLVDQATPDGHERTRVLVCGHRQLSAADRSTQLEHVMERI